MKKLFNISSFGIFVSVVYIGAIAWLRWPFSIPTLKEMPLNELGDFLAGVFGPLTLFWLILGFLLQKEELGQNTKALNMQADELRESVNQYKQMVAISQQQVKAELESLKIQQEEMGRRELPVFVITNIKTEKIMKDGGDPFEKNSLFQGQEFSHYLFSVEILNGGAPVTELDVHVESDHHSIESNSPHEYHFEHNQRIIISWEATEEAMHDTIDIIVICFNVSGKQFSKRFYLALGEGHEYHDFTIGENERIAREYKEKFPKKTMNSAQPLDESKILKYRDS